MIAWLVIQCRTRAAIAWLETLDLPDSPAERGELSELDLDMLRMFYADHARPFDDPDGCKAKPGHPCVVLRVLARIEAAQAAEAVTA